MSHATKTLLQFRLPTVVLGGLALVQLVLLLGLHDLYFGGGFIASNGVSGGGSVQNGHLLLAVARYDPWMMLGDSRQEAILKSGALPPVRVPDDLVGFAFNHHKVDPELEYFALGTERMSGGLGVWGSYLPNPARSIWDARVVISLWWTLLVTVVPTAYLGTRWRRNRFPPGSCRRCGYDLRASLDGCPECGLGKQGRNGDIVD